MINYLFDIDILAFFISFKNGAGEKSSINRRRQASCVFQLMQNHVELIIYSVQHDAQLGELRHQRKSIVLHVSVWRE